MKTYNFEDSPECFGSYFFLETFYFFCYYFLIQKKSRLRRSEINANPLYTPCNDETFSRMRHFKYTALYFLALQTEYLYQWELPIHTRVGFPTKIIAFSAAGENFY